MFMVIKKALRLIFGLKSFGKKRSLRHKYLEAFLRVHNVSHTVTKYGS